MLFRDTIKQKKFKSNYQMAVLNIFYTRNWLHDSLSPILKEAGITPQQFNVLRILKGSHPDACSAQDIKEVMLDKSPDLTRLLDRLIEKGYIAREICEGNRRKLDIMITETGTKLLDMVNPQLEHMDNENKRKITDSEATELSRILDKIRD